MKIEKCSVTRLRLTEIERLDPVTVILENYTPGKGKIIIECYGESWSSYWGAMSGDTIEEFFIRIDQGYAADNLNYMSCEVDDLEATKALIRKRVISKRRQENISKFTARKVFDIEEWSELAPTHPYDNWTCPFLINESEFKELELEDIDIQKEPNPKYVHLCRIIETVQQGLKLYINSKTNKDAA